MRKPILVMAALCLVFAPALPAQGAAPGKEQAELSELRRAQKRLHKLRATLPAGPSRAHLDRALRELEKAARSLRLRIAGHGKAPPAPAIPAGRLRAAIADGLLWLRQHQDDDGKWDADGFMKHDKGAGRSEGPGNPVQDLGATGLVVLAMLAEGSSLAAGPHRDALRKAVAWLRRQQGPNGLLGTNASHDFIYGHAIATWALCEALRTAPAPLDKALAGKAQRALSYLEQHRNPYAVWRYQPRDNDNDSSVTAWCAHALLAGRRAGLKINATALKSVEAFLDEITDPTRGTAGYTKRGEPSSRNPGDHGRRYPASSAPLTAAAMGLRLQLGQDPQRVSVIHKSAAVLGARPPGLRPASRVDHYYWFHGSLAMRQYGGADLEAWGRALAATALPSQVRTTAAKGSWDPAGVWGETGGRVYSTAMMCLALRLLEPDCKFMR